MSYKNRREIFYLFYMISTTALTIYLSLLIIEQGSKPKYKLIVPEPLGTVKNITSSENEAGNCPCKRIGVEPSYCRIYYHKESKNPLLNIELVPGVEQVDDGSGVCIPAYTVKINSYGFRDYEYSQNKPSGTFRIVALGDSYTFGHGVELNETYSKVLEMLLNERDDGWKYEVLNFGVPGDNVIAKVEVLNSKALRFDPDLIIFQYSGDDIVNWTEFRQIEKMEFQEYAEKVNRSVNELTHELTPFEGQIIHRSAYIEYLRELEEKKFDDAWGVVEESFERLASITQNKIGIVLLFPQTPGPLQSSRLKKISETYGWPIIDTGEVLSKCPMEKIIIHPNDNHPTAFAHKLMAEEILKELTLKGLLLK